MIKDNPLLKTSDAPFGAPRFDLIKKEHYLPAFKEAIEMARKEIDDIVSCPEEPSFSNTIEAIEYSGNALSGVEEIFFNLLEADSDEEMEKIAEEVSPLLTQFQMSITLNDALFRRVKAVWDKKDTLGLTHEQERLLEDHYKGFTRGGAGLPEDRREEYRKLNEELSLATLKFGNNVLAATNAFTLHLTEEGDLAGLPEYVRTMGAEEAKERGLDGWVFTLQFPSYAPFLKYSSRRDLREKMWRAYGSRAVGGENDNVPTISQIVELRMKISSMLGYETYADYALERRMAKDRRSVESFLSGLMERSLPFALKEIDEIRAFAASEGQSEDLMPWDFSYWSEKYKQKNYSLDEEALKPYFQLESCIDAVLGLATRLYGITFEERKDIPVYHKDVKVFDVKDENGQHLALFYADFFPRASKRGGAWMTEFRGQYRKDGKDFRPFISIVTNFSKPSADNPSLLTHSELETFLHEFGHSLHGMLSRGTYPSMCGTSVARDFVEFPSQIMEHWAYEPEFLDGFAKHYITGETIPDELVSRIVAAKNYHSGYQQVRQLQFGIIDMAWHTLKEMPKEDPVTFEKEVLSPFRTLPYVEGTATCPSFGHIFSGGYSAGYYSYKWAEVLEADGFAMFKENGIFDRATASRFRKEVLERGSSEDEAVLYRNFRGRDADPEALMVSLGLV